ncbi:Signal transduction histidine kinase [Actinokineospora alba]|uniref:Oxygen sensor histidine kinase NreB n=2 Tax=Actinokineospora alba TaxID=504798 RepID=A0A1H0LZK0_9PSEU|nr:signal transduction histidine kinase [Actinokineospora alba]SDI46503.1 Signal transduction histidine kinase [Actinokineospora alba]SDO73553.1 Signal transduction histidine kinase [Actinokineospora alba]
MWVAWLLYALVLAAGLYYAATGLGGDVQPTRLAGFVAGLAALAAVEPLGRTASLGWTVGLLTLKVGLFVLVAALDDSGLARALFVLVPFTAYLTICRRAGLLLGAVCMAALLASFSVAVPDWHTDAGRVSDVLMFGVGLVLALSMAAIAVDARRGAARMSELAAANERNRLARDIHDSLGHHLTAISVQLEKASAFRDLDPAAAERSLSDARSAVRRALDDVRLSVRTLRADTPFSLTTAVAELVGNAPGVTLSVEGVEDGTDQATRTTLFRAAQEAITNARRHGQARAVAVSLAFDQPGTRLVVTDDGRGFDPAGAEGYGLLGMRERAALVGGRVEVSSTPGAGARIAVTVP